jgi:hypothetical protein
MIILRVWTKQPGNYFCISSKTPDGAWRDEFFTRKQFRIIPRYLKELNEDGCDAYWCPHGFSKARRLKRYAVMPYLLWADIDEVDPATLPLRPSVLWESSPGRYAGLWTLQDVLSSDDINKKFTYKIGADKGGWDLTQVLRVPGTHNHKYPAKPLVKLLWDDPRIDYSEKTDILPLLPKSRTSNKQKEASKNAKEIFTKYKKHLTPWARREMLSGKPAHGKRSEVFWKLTNELIEAGADEDEAFTLLWSSPWNKFHSRRDGEDQLQREIDKVYTSKFTGPEGLGEFEEESAIKAEEDADRINEGRSIILASTPPLEPDWIQYPFFARGHITTVEGAPEVGKSWFCLAAGCAIAEGKKPFPQDGWDLNIEQGMVLYFDAENMSANISMRMQDSGMLTQQGDPHESAPFFHIPPEFFSPNLGDPDIVEEFDALVKEITETMWNNKGKFPCKVKAIVFDTLVNYSGVTDSSSQGDVIQIMNNLKELAVHFDCSVVAIRHHGKSLAGKDPMHRGVGSVQYGGSARIVIGIYAHPEDPAARVVMLGKNNLANKHFIRPLVYSLEPVFPTSTDVKKRDRAKMVWGGFCDLTDTDLFITQSERDERRKDHIKDNQLLTDVMAELEEQYSEGTEPAKIPMGSIKSALNKTNIPEIKKLSEALKPLGYMVVGRGARTHYTRSLQ